MHTHTLWAARVAAGTVLPDKRLLARLACILETFAERPSDAIPQAAGSWGQAKGIYRFLANQRVLPAALHQGLTSDTARQCLDQTTVLVVQDTTSLHLTGCHMLPELGPMRSGNGWRRWGIARSSGACKIGGWKHRCGWPTPRCGPSRCWAA